MLKNLDKLIRKETGVPVTTTDEPLTCVARGGGKVLEMINEHGPHIFALE
jgi:rod shape-determining protein MreB